MCFLSFLFLLFGLLLFFTKQKRAIRLYLFIAFAKTSNASAYAEGCCCKCTGDKKDTAAIPAAAHVLKAALPCRPVPVIYVFYTRRRMRGALRADIPVFLRCQTTLLQRLSRLQCPRCRDALCPSRRLI